MALRDGAGRRGAGVRARRGLVPERSRPRYMREARAAYQRDPGASAHLRSRRARGSASTRSRRCRVLNAQLQAVSRCSRTPCSAEDAEAARARGAHAARGGRDAARASTPATGRYYALPHDPSPLDYQQYVVQLLQQARSQPTRASPTPRRASPRTRSSRRRSSSRPAALGALRFWLSKPSTVAGRHRRRPDAARQPSTAAGTRFAGASRSAPGVYPVHVTAIDSAGNQASFDALPIVRVGSTAPKREDAIDAPRRRCDRRAVVRASAPGSTDPSQGALAQKAGLHLVRVGVTWPAGATAPDPALVAALQQLPGEPRRRRRADRDAASGRRCGSRRARAVRGRARAAGARAPLSRPRARSDDRDRSRLRGSARALRPAVQAAVPDALVGLALDGSATTTGTIAALAGRRADVVAFRPAPAPGKGLWTLANLPQLSTALTAAYGVAPPVIVDGPAAPIAPVDRRSCVHAGARRCGRRPAQRRHAPPRCSRDRRSRARRDGVPRARDPGVCHRHSSYPDRAGAARSACNSRCDRDCLYLVTLDGPDGRPVVARRGAVARRPRTPARITLAEREARDRDLHRLDVRLVAQVNPGAVTKLESPPLAAG